METLLLSVLKPHSRSYSLADLGPAIFQVNGKVVHRTDHIEQRVPFSFYQVAKDGPTVLYIHSYNSNRLEPLTLLTILLENAFNVATIQLQRVDYNKQLQRMDISTDGMVSFGYYEQEQVGPVVAWLKRQSKEKVYLWGRSMGAVTALLYQSRHAAVDGLILDSPFHSLHEIFLSQFTTLTKLPRVLGQGAIFVADCTFKNLLRFSINELNILNILAIDCPAFIISNPKDVLAGTSSTLIYNQCKGIRKILYSQAEHSASRQKHILLQIVSHLNKLQKQRKMLNVKKSLQQLKVSTTNKTQECQSIPYRKRKEYIKLTQVKSAKNIAISQKEMKQ